MPQALVMRHVDAVVCHAGSGTMLGVREAGRRWSRCRSARTSSPTPSRSSAVASGWPCRRESRTPATVRAAIKQVLNSLGFAQAAYAVQAEIAAMPSAERRAADLVARVESTSEALSIA